MIASLMLTKEETRPWRRSAQGHTQPGLRWAPGSRQVGTFGSLQAGREEGSTLALLWDLTLVSVAGHRGYLRMEPRTQRDASAARKPRPLLQAPAGHGTPETARACYGAAGPLLPPPKSWTGDLNPTFLTGSLAGVGGAFFSAPSSAQLSHSGKCVCVGRGGGRGRSPGTEPHRPQ